MNWFFKLMFVGISWSTVFMDIVVSPKRRSVPNLKMIESVFKSSFENASYRKSFDVRRPRVKVGDNDQDILSYRQHGFHPGNEDTWKMQCVWKAMNNAARQLPGIVSSAKESRVRGEVRKLCMGMAASACGLDMNETTCDPYQVYRSMDGTCNNLNNTRWGSAPQPFERYIPSDYGDGFSSFRLSERGNELPNPRKISRALSGSKQGEKPEITLMLMQWGQFLDHDITLTPERESEKKRKGASDSEIPLGASNVVHHSGVDGVGGGPENLLKDGAYWNPNPKPWFVIFDLGQSHVVSIFKVRNFGDTTHDMTAFKLDSSEDLKNWNPVKTVNNVQTGNDKVQTFSLSGSGRYWCFTVTATAKGNQPRLWSVTFSGSKRTSDSQIPLTASNIVGHGGSGTKGGPENLLQNGAHWNPNQKPWFVVFDFGHSCVVSTFQIRNFGDTTHDVTAFTLESSEDMKYWNKVKTVVNVQTGTDKIQSFNLRGKGRYWHFTVTDTAGGFQPWVWRIAFFGSENQIEEPGAMMCCDGGRFKNSESLWDECTPIDVMDDSFYEQDNRECIRFVRSMPCLKDCDHSPMEQINRNTAFVDGSMVYGVDADVAAYVRTGVRGFLNTSKHVDNGKPLLPRGGDGFAHECPLKPVMNTCFLAGDVRVDEIPGLTAMHTIFVRLHNIIAEELCQINPGWADNDEKLFQETRRIVIALIQQITYRDWLPFVIGETLMVEYHLSVGNQGYRDTYDPNENPTIRNVFATAAFRFGHSLIADAIKTAKPENDLQVPGNFFNPHVIENTTTGPISLLKGLIRCPSAPIDVVVELSYTNSLFAHEASKDGNFYGLDLVSLNIQRGRDHGIPGYRKWRTFAGLEDISTFSKLRTVMRPNLYQEFGSLYSKVDDIDLYPAGLAENPIHGGILGPTFSYILARQFANMKHGDRFWYEREDQPKPFTPDQLSSIRSQALVSILCKVSEHTPFGFQPNPFLVESKLNAPRDCSSYNFINLQPWKENKKVSDFCAAAEGTKVGTQCLFFEKDKIPYLEAVKSCKREGKQLAIPIDPAALKIYHIRNFGYNDAFWLGGTDSVNEGNWVWNDGRPFYKFPWEYDQPDNGKKDSNSNGQDCLALGWNHGYDDKHCKEPNWYICELKDPECPSPFFSLGGQCFCVEGSYYNNRNWGSARAYCGTLAPDGDLAQPRNIKALADYLNPIHNTYYWLGGSDLAHEGQWCWVNGSAIGSGWHQDEPDNAGGKENCLAMHPAYGANSLFDIGCHVTHTMKFVCERNRDENHQ